MAKKKKWAKEWNWQPDNILAEQALKQCDILETQAFHLAVLVEDLIKKLTSIQQMAEYAGRKAAQIPQDYKKLRAFAEKLGWRLDTMDDNTKILEEHESKK